MAVLPKMVGERIKRREDPALIQGYGKYVDDVPMVGTLHAAFYRSPSTVLTSKRRNIIPVW
jgi:carbon-monoxide dehydrogenase large subunit